MALNTKRVADIGSLAPELMTSEVGRVQNIVRIINSEFFHRWHLRMRHVGITHVQSSCPWGVLAHMWQSFSHFRQRVRRVKVRRSISSQPCPPLLPRWKRLSLVSKPGQHLRISIWHVINTSLTELDYYVAAAWGVGPYKGQIRLNFVLPQIVEHSSGTDRR